MDITILIPKPHILLFGKDGHLKIGALTPMEGDMAVACPRCDVIHFSGFRETRRELP